MDLLAQPDEQQLQRMFSEFGMTPAGLERDVAHVQEWLSKQPHLPSPVDERRLKHFLLYNKNSIEDAKRQVDVYYSIRTAVPDLFTERDPFRPELLQCASVICLAPLPKLTYEGFRINMFRLMDTDPDKFHMEPYIKWAFMTAEIRMLEDIVLENIFLIDLEGVTLKHVPKLTLQLLRKYTVCGQSVFLSRLKQLHIINAPAFVEKLTGMFRPFLKDKVYERINVHPKGYDQLHKCFSKDLLPLDYGGTMPSLQEINDAWTAKVHSYRAWFLREETIRADESRRPHTSSGWSASELELFGPDGSFRKLELD